MGNREDSETQEKLRNLKEDFDRNEELMREAARHYEDLVAIKEDLASAMAELRKTNGPEPKQVSE